jgi:MoaA/NifB/PqqE/SkfB family radical SAM enzyme
MKLTLDILLAGCQTKCRHCYVDGGPGPAMSERNALRILEYLKQAAPRLRERFSQVDPYFDFEPFSHPRIVAIAGAFHDAGFSPVMEHVPTTGIALVTRADRDEVFDFVRSIGVRRFELTVHGPLEVHESALERPGAFDLQVRFSRAARSAGFPVNVNLMLSREVANNFDRTHELIDRLAPGKFWFTIPTFEPVARLRSFQSHRPQLRHLQRLSRHPLAGNARNLDLLLEAEDRTTAHWLARARAELNSWDDVQRSMPEWVFATIQPDLQVYAGNGNMRLTHIGDLSGGASSGVTDTLLELASNYAIFRYPERESLPTLSEVLRAAESHDPDLVFPEIWDMLSSVLDGMVVGQ